MKIKKGEKGSIEYVKLNECNDCGRAIMMVDEEHVSGSEFLARDWKVIEIEREEMTLFNLFLEDAGHCLRVGWDYVDFTINKEMEEMEESEGGEDAEETRE